MSLLWGCQRGLDGINGALGDLGRMLAHSPPAIHYDIEPKAAANRGVYLAGFLDFYATMLTHAQFGETDVSAYINPYWADVSPYWAAQVHDHDALDRIVIAAYRDSVAEILDRIELVRDSTSKPYYAALELQDPTDNPVVDPSITLWDEARDASAIIDTVAANAPDQDAFEGIGLHYYQPAVSEHY